MSGLETVAVYCNVLVLAFPSEETSEVATFGSGASSHVPSIEMLPEDPGDMSNDTETEMVQLPLLKQQTGSSPGFGDTVMTANTFCE